VRNKLSKESKSSDAPHAATRTVPAHIRIHNGRGDLLEEGGDGLAVVDVADALRQQRAHGQLLDLVRLL